MPHHFHLNCKHFPQEHVHSLLLSGTLGHQSSHIWDWYEHLLVLHTNHWTSIPSRLFASRFPSSFLFFFFLKGGKTVLYRQPSVSLSFRPSNSPIHYGAFLTSAAWQHNKDDILIQWLVISAKQRRVLRLLLLC